MGYTPYTKSYQKFRRTTSKQKMIIKIGTYSLKIKTYNHKELRLDNTYEKYSNYSIKDFHLNETSEMIHVKAKLTLIPTEQDRIKNGVLNMFLFKTN